MIEIKHTAGPWEVEREIDAEDDDSMMFVTKIGPFHIEWHEDLNQNNPDRIEADIALASSAPELLEALKALLMQQTTVEVLGEWEATDTNFRHRKEVRARVDAVNAQCRAAIAKATGAHPC
jgi:hypothetical protein